MTTEAPTRTLADVLTHLGEVCPQAFRINAVGGEVTIFSGGRTGHIYRLGSLAYAESAFGLLDDLLKVCDLLGVYVTLARMLTITPFYVAVGASQGKEEAQWRGSGTTPARAVAEMLDAALSAQ